MFTFQRHAPRSRERVARRDLCGLSKSFYTFKAERSTYEFSNINARGRRKGKISLILNRGNKASYFSFALVLMT